MGNIPLGKSCVRFDQSINRTLKVMCAIIGGHAMAVNGERRGAAASCEYGKWVQPMRVARSGWGVTQRLFQK
jgi:hypothetical protein